MVIHDFRPSALEAEAQVEASLIYLVSSRTAKAAKRPCLKRKKKPSRRSEAASGLFGHWCTGIHRHVHIGKNKQHKCISFQLGSKVFYKANVKVSGT